MAAFNAETWAVVPVTGAVAIAVEAWVLPASAAGVAYANNAEIPLDVFLLQWRFGTTTGIRARQYFLDGAQGSESLNIPTSIYLLPAHTDGFAPAQGGSAFTLPAYIYGVAADIAVWRLTFASGGDSIPKRYKMRGRRPGTDDFEVWVVAQGTPLDENPSGAPIDDIVSAAPFWYPTPTS